MDFTLPYFIELHHKVQTTSLSKVKHAILLMDRDCLKLLLETYCKYFYNPSNRQRLEHANRQNHSNIINKINKLNPKPNTRIASLLSNVFHTVPQILLSYVMSFLDRKSRSNMPFVSYCFLQSSKQPISISTLKITPKFINKQLTQNYDVFKYQKYSNRREITFHSRYCPPSKTKTANVVLNISKILQSESNKHVILDFEYSKPVWLNFNSFRFSHIQTLTIRPSLIPYFNIHSPNIKSLTISGYYTGFAKRREALQSIKSLYINTHFNTTNLTRQTINISGGDAVIQKYIKSRNISNLQHLYLGAAVDVIPLQCENTSVPHPIFWLWNIPTLQTCKLKVTLPTANVSKTEFEKLLAVSGVIERARNQKGFQSLSLIINAVCFRRKERNTQPLFTNDVNTFLKFLSKLYRNLTFLHYQFGDETFKYEAFLLKLHCKEAFDDIQNLDIDVLSAESGSDILHYLLKHKCIKSCTLSNTKMKTQITVGKNTYWHNENSLRLFIDNLCQFIQSPPKTLRCFAVMFYNGNGIQHRHLMQTYWNIYEKLLKTIANHTYIFDGYLQLQLPEIQCFRKKISNYHDWIFGIYEWNQNNKEYSLKITQLICNIQIKIQKYNAEHLNDKKKLVLNLNGLHLMGEHRNFLEFWFNYDSCLYYDEQFVFQ